LCSRGSAWFFGDVSYDKSTHSIRFTPTLDDIVDHGNYYAPTAMHDPVTDQYISWGWSTEDDGPSAEQRTWRGWAGMLSVPREMYVQVHSHVSAETAKSLGGPWIHDVDEHGVSRVKTFGQRPIRALERLRESSVSFDLARSSFGNFSRNLVGVDRAYSQYPLKVGDLFGLTKRRTVVNLVEEFRSDSYEVEAVVDFSSVKSCKIFGLVVRASIETKEQGGEKTLVYYDFTSQQLVVDRSKSSTNLNFNHASHVAPLTLIRKEDGSLEKLHLRVFVDRGVVEVFGNERYVKNNI
jgi:sucrose-6-phosphate hydrolase SacC (GH32 family)